MKLLFDCNLSHKLPARLADLYPGSTHPRIYGNETDGDEVIWLYAKENDFIIVTRDDDFHHLSSVYGSPPKLIWIRHSNSPTGDIEKMLRINYENISVFYNNPKLHCLFLW
ncbi:MAG TPA: DUF5615 family PIN-like protein [Leptospiraceae bacterium]|nr:DUF5615 family PIN-like protein [Leptospiraceae bacterium]HMZ57414.1 DUF5615 family PIN-like protein [Leptospiraceae bacterium]HNF14441.1 DUF5615 family PIN-like protein [Leptospiraceae bacterium]HNH10745.1 DUF5615 family PIN-like protein [Leptospiraceae bacterium]HNM02847.1 DUF5615 family PIN-like protein [Leptospiraceae bacterium]